MPLSPASGVFGSLLGDLFPIDNGDDYNNQDWNPTIPSQQSLQAASLAVSGFTVTEKSKVDLCRNVSSNWTRVPPTCPEWRMVPGGNVNLKV